MAVLGRLAAEAWVGRLPLATQTRVVVRREGLALVVVELLQGLPVAPRTPLVVVELMVQFTHGSTHDHDRETFPG